MRYQWSICLLLVLLFGVLHCESGVPKQAFENKAEGVPDSLIRLDGVPKETSRQESQVLEKQSQDGTNPKEKERVEPPTREASIEKTTEKPWEPQRQERLVSEPSVPDRSVPEQVQPEQPNSPDVSKKWLAGVTCASTPPAGAKLALPPKKYTGGTCPTLKAGYNTIKSKGNQRKFLLVLPKNRKKGEKFPVLFMWHWLKGKAAKFLTQGDVQKSVDQLRFIAVIPESKGDLNMIVVKVPWPFLNTVPKARFEEEYTFFDDMLSCVSQQFNVNKECVSTTGVSAGALFTAQLATARSRYLSSFLSLSGGVDQSAGAITKVPKWKTAPHRLPALVLWGGAQDSCVLLNFEKASQKLEQALQKDGHFFLECIHNCKHSEPPIKPLPGKSKYEALWDFFLRHPYWLPAGTSPFQVIKWPHTNLPWCAIGAGKAKIRTGSCPPPSCPI